MTERLLQFIWQFQYFNKSELTTDDGQSLRIINQGLFNHNQGPDFSSGQVTIGETIWAGTIELHVCTSDWNRHHHQSDSNYKNVILHVVWQHDDHDSHLPVLELKSRVPKLLLHRYRELMNADSFIPCGKNIRTTPDLLWKSWKERLLAERLLQKASVIESWLTENKNHWEETFWWLLARSFGLRVNADAFEEIARSLPLKLLVRLNDLFRLEALLFGQAGLLKGKFSEDYPRRLKKEYQFHQSAYHLQPIHLPLLFLRMRPGNFPTLRLGQLAGVIHNSMHLFSKIKEATDLKNVKKHFAVYGSEYWDRHYRFEKISAFRKKTPSASTIDTIIINAVVPMIFAYGHYHQNEDDKDKGLRWLEETKTEVNTVLDKFRQLGITSNTAYDSQALIELKTKYCDQKRCLDCAVGNFLLKPKSK